MNEVLSTKDRILDSAEKLFGTNGFEATSLRDITADANANLAAVNYYFQTKDSLVDEIIARRIEPVNCRRLELLEAASPNASVEQILTAFLTPILELELEKVIPLMGKILGNPGQFVDRIYLKHFTHVGQRFREALGAALPEVPPEEIAWRMQYTIGAMTHLLSWGQLLPRLTGGVCDLSNRQAAVERAVHFLAAGFRAPASKKEYKDQI